MRRIRAHIAAGTFAEFRKKFVSEYVPWKPEEVEGAAPSAPISLE
jgi:queuine/archaeosine tRNA-ribosyltransferase